MHSISHASSITSGDLRIIFLVRRGAHELNLIHALNLLFIPDLSEVAETPNPSGITTVEEQRIDVTGEHEDIGLDRSEATLDRELQPVVIEQLEHVAQGNVTLEVVEDHGLLLVVAVEPVLLHVNRRVRVGVEMMSKPGLAAARRTPEKVDLGLAPVLGFVELVGESLKATKVPHILARVFTHELVGDLAISNNALCRCLQIGATPLFLGGATLNRSSAIQARLFLGAVGDVVLQGALRSLQVTTGAQESLHASVAQLLGELNVALNMEMTGLRSNLQLKHQELDLGGEVAVAPLVVEALRFMVDGEAVVPGADRGALLLLALHRVRTGSRPRSMVDFQSTARG